MSEPLKRIIAALIPLFLPLFSFAQERSEMADVMRSNGKIYVVVAVLVIIFSMLLIYLISLDRKIRRLEKETQAEE